MIPAGIAVAEVLARQSAVALLAGIAYALPIAAVAWTIVRMSPRANAATRYGIWSAALAATVLLDPLPGHPFSIFTATARAAAGSIGGFPAISLPPQWALWLFVAWYAIATALIIRLIVGHVCLHRIIDRAEPLGEPYRSRLAAWMRLSDGRRAPRLLASSDVDTPLAIGLLHPAIVIPKHLVTQLADDELDQICLHELAHLQRGDDWTNLVQKIAEALLFFSPAVHIIAREMSVEREIACDDWVVAITGSARPYATCLTRLAELTSLRRRAALPSLGAFVTRKQIFVRIERLIHRTHFVQPGIALAGSWATCAVLLALLAGEAQLSPIVTIAPPDAGAQSAMAHAWNRVLAKTASAVSVHASERAGAHNRSLTVSMCPLARPHVRRAAHALLRSRVGLNHQASVYQTGVLASSGIHTQEPGGGGMPAGGAATRNARAARARGVDAASAELNY